MLTVTDETPEMITFSVKNVALANSIRMIMLSEVETLAIHKIYFQENTSSLCDELIAHRLGLLVVNSRFIDQVDAKQDILNEKQDHATVDGVVPDTISENGDESITFSLDIVCEEDELMVTPSMFKCSNDLVTPVNLNTPLIKLLRGQRLKFLAVVQRGNGKIHAKWIPMSLDHYDIDEDGVVTMRIESSGSLDAPDILRRGLLQFKSKLSALVSALN